MACPVASSVARSSRKQRTHTTSCMSRTWRSGHDCLSHEWSTTRQISRPLHATALACTRLLVIADGGAPVAVKYACVSWRWLGCKAQAGLTCGDSVRPQSSMAHSVSQYADENMVGWDGHVTVHSRVHSDYLYGFIFVHESRQSSVRSSVSVQSCLRTCGHRHRVGLWIGFGVLPQRG